MQQYQKSRVVLAAMAAAILIAGGPAQALPIAPADRGTEAALELSSMQIRAGHRGGAAVARGQRGGAAVVHGRHGSAAVVGGGRYHGGHHHGDIYRGGRYYGPG